MISGSCLYCVFEGWLASDDINPDEVMIYYMGVWHGERNEKLPVCKNKNAQAIYRQFRDGYWQGMRSKGYITDEDYRLKFED